MGQIYLLEFPTVSEDSDILSHKNHTGQCLRRIAGGKVGLPLDTTYDFWNKMAVPIKN